MERCLTSPRANWGQTLMQQGLTYYALDDCPYWDENACYRFDAGDIARIEDATNTLHALCMEAVAHVIQHDLFHLFGVPEAFVPFIIRSWERRDPYVYGRFDLAYDGMNPPKMLEYNADTPTMLPETSVMQWFWLNDKMASGDIAAEADQFNHVHDALIQSWKMLLPRYGDRGTVYFTAPLYPEKGVITNLEDYQNVQYMRDTCAQAGFATDLIDLADIGWNGTGFTDMAERPIHTLYKLYPWEFIAADSFAGPMAQADMAVIEPVWKMLLSNKAILPILWTLFKGHPNLLPASFVREEIQGAVVQKAKLGREGANVTIVGDHGTIARDGPYGAEGYVYQAYHAVPTFDGNTPILGSWVVSVAGDDAQGFGQRGQACGMGIREDKTAITNNFSRFIPHYILDV